MSCSLTACTSSSSRDSWAFSIITTRYASVASFTSSGTPRSTPMLRVMPAIVSVSMYSRISGPTPLATIRGTACMTSSRVRNGASTVALCAARRVQPQRRLRDQRQRALGADDQLREVVAGRRLHEAAAGADDLAGRQHRLDPEHLVTGHAVLHRAHAARVGGDVATEARAVLARVDGVDQTVGRRDLVELGQRDARAGRSRRGSPRRSRARGSCARRRRRCRPRSGSPRRTAPFRCPARSPATPSLAGQPEDGRDLGGVSRTHDRDGRHRSDAERLVVGVVVGDASPESALSAPTMAPSAASNSSATAIV